MRNAWRLHGSHSEAVCEGSRIQDTEIKKKFGTVAYGCPTGLAWVYIYDPKLNIVKVLLNIHGGRNTRLAVSQENRQVSLFWLPLVSDKKDYSCMKIKGKNVTGDLERVTWCTVVHYTNEISCWIWLVTLRARDRDATVSPEKWPKVQIQATFMPGLLTSISLISLAHHLVGSS